MKIQQGYLTEESGAYIGHYSKWVIDPLTGEKKRLQRAFKIGPVESTTLTKAKEALRERIVEELGLTADSRVTFAWFAEYRWKPMRSGVWRESTTRTSEELLKILTDRFGQTAVEDMDQVEMQTWLNAIARTRSGSAVKHLRIFLMSIMKEAAEEGYIRRDPARLLRVPRVRPVRRNYLTEQEITKLLKACKWQPRERVLLMLMFVTGLRPSELFALRWSCLTDGFQTATIKETVYRGKIRPYTKTTEEGDTEYVTVWIAMAVATALAQWHAKAKYNGDDDFVFANTEGGFITKENYQRRTLDPLAELAGIPRFNFQTLRRSVATHAQHLASPKDISTILRHRKTETAQAHYVMAIEQSVRDATEKLASALLGSGARE